MRIRITALTSALVALTLPLAGCMSNPPEAAPAQPDTLWQQAREVTRGDPWLVGVGDSFISGEGGRWASNGTSNAQIPENGGWMLGTSDQAYGDAANGTETIPYCHRSATATSFVGDGWNVKNLACSGAMTTSFVKSYGRAKPGIDFASTQTPGGLKFVGQAQLLQDFAKDHDVKAVALSIGGNDLGFADIIATCLTDWIVDTKCSNSDFIAARINPAAKKIITNRVFAAIENVNQAMTKAGYKPDQWRLMVQLPPSPVPPAELASYPDVGFSRQILGGCGMLDADLNFANDTLLPFLDSTVVSAAAKAEKNKSNAPITTVDMKDALVGHRLCEKGTTRPDAGTGIPPNGFAQNTEWVRFISVLAAEGYAESSEAQEAVHPTYFGQRTLSSCMRAALALPPATEGVFCTRDEVLSFNEDSQPKVTVTAAKLPY
ncbi:MAG TPA: hypothetical protein DCQ04_02900 [Actinobacteria bacterium]|nr:hypothetical protein [Actinomycetota bacterium]